MKKVTIFRLIVSIAVISIFSVTQVLAFEIITAKDIKQNLVTKDVFIKTADNFVVLFDASGSMGDEYKEGEVLKPCLLVMPSFVRSLQYP